MSQSDTSFVTEMIEFKIFCRTIYSSNQLFMPACNGEQFGNTAVLKLIHRKSLMILTMPDKTEYTNIIKLAQIDN